jgi:hypothetical protein
MQRSRSTHTTKAISKPIERQTARTGGKTQRRRYAPLAIETLGTAGGKLQELGKALKRSFETTVLPVDDCSASADFRNTWMYRLSRLQFREAQLK